MEHEVQNCEMSRVYNYTQHNDTSVNKHLIVKKRGTRSKEKWINDDNDLGSIGSGPPPPPQLEKFKFNHEK